MAPLLSRFSNNFGLVLGNVGTSAIDGQTVYSSILANPLSGSAPSYTTNSDPNSSFLVLALPFVSSGRDSGFGDYSGDIRSTTNRTVSEQTQLLSIQLFQNFMVLVLILHVRCLSI